MRSSVLAVSIAALLAGGLSGCGLFSEESEPPVDEVVAEPLPPPPLPEPVPEEPVEEEAVVQEEDPERKPSRRSRWKHAAAAAAAEEKPVTTRRGLPRSKLPGPERKPSALSNQQIKSTILKRIPQVRACYERELKKNSSLAGKVLATWTIRPDGSVESTRIKKNTTGSRALLPCISKAVSSWRFPASKSSADVEYPFVFRPTEKW